MLVYSFGHGGPAILKKGNNPSVVGLNLMTYRHLVAAVLMFGCISPLRKLRATFLLMFSSNRERENKDRERLAVVQLAHIERGEEEKKNICCRQRPILQKLLWHRESNPGPQPLRHHQCPFRC